MYAKECRIGKRLRTQLTKEIFEIQEIDGVKFWVNLKWGDRYDWIDEDLFEDLDYISE